MILDKVTEVVRSYSVFVDEASKILKRLEQLSGMSMVPILFGVHRYINALAVDSIYTVLRELRSIDRLGVILFSSGGDIDEAYLLARYLQSIAREKLVFYIPRYAKSAATLLVCAGDEIAMLPVAELGPIDPVLYDSKNDRYVPMQSILELIDMLSKKEIPKDMMKEILDRLPVIELGDYKRAVEHNIELCARILSNRMLRDDPEKAWGVARRLASFKQHGAAITVEDARELGLKIRVIEGEEAELLWRLHQLWIERVVETEYLAKHDPEPIEFRLGKGIVLTIAPREIVEEAKKR